MNCVLRDHTSVPAIGQGSWYLGESPRKRAGELEALRTGIELGMTLLDTAEMYGEGLAEELIGEAIQGYSSAGLFLVSKVYPHHAGQDHIFRSCEESLRRMKTDYLDLYLLHWRGSIPLAETAGCMEELVRQGKILRWGVSNFDTEDMKELWSVPSGDRCMVNQVLYHAASRGIEYDLLPWMERHDVALMAYCPLAQAGRISSGLLRHPVLEKIAARHQATAAQILLSFTIRSGRAIAIPRTGRASHTLENSRAGEIRLSPEDFLLLDEAFPAPKRKVPLDMQ